MSAELKSRFRTGAKICSGVIIILLLVAALGPAKWAPRTELGWQFDHFIGYFGITLFVCIAWPRPVVVGGIIMAVAALLESLQALTPDRSANLEAALWGASGALAAALVAELFIQRHLVAVLTAVAAALAWQSYGDAAKQIIATKAPELGWSPEAKQMIASWTLGWTKPPASPEKIAPETAAPKAPPASSLDPAQVQQIAQSLAAVRETLQELAGSQRSMARDIARLQSAVAEILKIKEPLPQPPAAPARKPPAAPSSSRAPMPLQQ
jgi:VanZ family protein